MKKIQVAITGAGISGLCLAQGLHQQGIDFEVFERDEAPDSRTQGYRIRIDLNGQEALRFCLSPDTYTLFRDTCAIPHPGVRTLQPTLDTVNDKWIYSWMDSSSDDAADLKAHRLTLREILMGGIREHIHFNHNAVNWEVRNDGKIALYFPDGNMHVCDVLVAADGVNSAIARQLFPGSAPVDTGNICIYGKTLQHNNAVADILKTGTSTIFDAGLAVIIDAMKFKASPQTLADESGSGIRLTHVDDYMYWAIIGHRSALNISPAHPLRYTPEALHSMIGERIRNWAPSLRALFEQADMSMATIIPVRSAGTLQPRLPNTITGMGDALHVMSPAAGLGANTALQDAALLAANLGKAASGTWPLTTAIADYEQRMISYSSAAVHASTAGGKQLFGEAD
ncbi:2-polyprenyl-6-methoxyphenol hydroxylase-like FAD-dependent oxidoreductase [Chitinophaga polysaccharea]|uniref:2-polyprenyl-6-methoxyphenol hydroxylase-like FAD-dependent oxidoreductase n=1 Tax=Chitinophaga polysaccharea TaxID=1293035 RepID=A0A561PA50_9BACT|nr:FAD-dependent monooxygenase [Chitinophaga polysaccharea]TWF34916.1 2-polyprenyl-6-methoxyphenol hydroxylase-like FAD-dependent oxidoreductase [Chitinophaga polysaccharea]